METVAFESLPGSKHQAFWQVVPGGQTYPQDPQFPESLLRSLHVPLHNARPEKQEVCTAAVVAGGLAGPVTVVRVGAGDGVPVGAGDATLVFLPDDPLNVPFLQVSPKGTENPHAPQ